MPDECFIANSRNQVSIATVWQEVGPPVLARMGKKEIKHRSHIRVEVTSRMMACIAP